MLNAPTALGAPRASAQLVGGAFAGAATASSGRYQTPARTRTRPGTSGRIGVYIDPAGLTALAESLALGGDVRRRRPAPAPSRLEARQASCADVHGSRRATAREPCGSPASCKRRRPARIPFGRIGPGRCSSSRRSPSSATRWPRRTSSSRSSEEPYEVEVVLPDAKGLEPVQGARRRASPARPPGKVVERRDRARPGAGDAAPRLATSRARSSTTPRAVVRPTSALQTLIVNIDPGHPRRGALTRATADPAGAHARRSSHIDELTGVLDADTQAQVQVLIRERPTRCDGREPELRGSSTELGRLTDGATPLAEALAERRELLRRLDRQPRHAVRDPRRPRGEQLGARGRRSATAPSR